jgi:hypothetical protein
MSRFIEAMNMPAETDPSPLAGARRPSRKGRAVILSTLPLADTDNMIPMRTS